MFDALNEDLLLELEQALPIAIKTLPESSWNGTHVVQILNTCLQEVVSEMGQCTGIEERNQWRSVYAGVETMLTVMDWLKTGVPARSIDLQ